MSKKYYTCNICGRNFENYRDKERHQETCGKKSLDHFTKSKTKGTTNLK